jgi:biuret amidohydrolase
MPVIDALPRPFFYEIASTALIVVDMQRDFLGAKGWAAATGLDVNRLTGIVPNVRTLLACARAAGMMVIHTREGHRPDLNDCPPTKRFRRKPYIGEEGEEGRYLVTGEFCNDIIDELKPLPSEVVLDKPGKGAFYATSFEHILRINRISTLVLAGVTAEMCVEATIREANDRGFDCLLVEDATDSYDAELLAGVLRLLRRGTIGSSAPLANVVASLQGQAATVPDDALRHTKLA